MATPSVCSWSVSSPSSAAARRARAARSRSPPPTRRPSATARRRSSWPARRPASSCRSAAARGSATPASASSAPAACAICATGRSTAARARWSARASARPRARSRSTFEETTMIESPLARLSEEQIDALGRILDRMHDEVYESLGDRDRRYIVAMIELHRRLSVLGRVLLFGSRFKAAWLGGTTATSLAKILENMEIGHNVLHGQWDWMNDPQIHSSTWDWDTASTAEAWKHSHNYIHHTYTNIRGKDKDLGYEIMRIDPHQKWHPVYLLQPIYNLLLMAFFEWGVATHDLDLEALRKGEKSKEQLAKELKGIGGKARRQVVKDYVAWPLISALAAAGARTAVELSAGDRGSRRERLARRVRRRPRTSELAARALQRGAETYRATLLANATANVVRN